MRRPAGRTQGHRKWTAPPPSRRPALAAPLEVVLGATLRRVAGENPAAFDRLGAYRDAAFLIIPNGAPVAFRLEPAGRQGRVTVVQPDDPRPVAASVRGPLVDLIALFAGVYDADAAFFARRIEVDGDTSAIMALHNALEAADLGVGDLIGAPRHFRPRLNASLAALLTLARARAPLGA